MNKKILHLNFSDDGGAGIAVKRINECLLKLNIDTKILVAEKNTKNKNIIYNQSSFNSFLWKQKKKISRNLKFFFKTNNRVTHSVSFIKSNILSQIEKYNPDILNIHWIGNELISLEQIKKIKIPILWTLHDMWLYCGAEHYTYNSDRFVNGYLKENRPSTETGFDLNKWVWKRKKKNLPKEFDVIATSSWQYNNAKKSNLLKDKKIHKLALPINTNFWKPIEKKEARKILGWDFDKIYFLFGFSHYGKKYIKGLDISLNIFENFKNQNPKKNVNLNIFGETKNYNFGKNNVNLLGQINDSHKLKLIYSASDLLLNTSRLESLGQIALESLSCNLPIVVMKNSGTSDLILNENMGFKFDENIDEFNKWFLKIHSNINQNNLHSEIEKKFSYEVIGECYKRFFENYK